MSEKNTRSKIVKALKDYHAIPVENMVGTPGVPDVATTLGWIEAKYRRSWPKRESIPVRLDHPYTTSQIRWARRQMEAGGPVFVIVQIAKDWLLFDNLTASLHLAEKSDHLPKAELIDAALAHWSGYEEFSNSVGAILVGFSKEISPGRPLRPVRDSGGWGGHAD